MGTGLMIKDTKECRVKAAFHLPCASPSFRNRSIATWKLHGGRSRFKESKNKATAQSWLTTCNTKGLGGRWVPWVSTDRSIKHWPLKDQVLACIRSEPEGAGCFLQPENSDSTRSLYSSFLSFVFSIYLPLNQLNVYTLQLTLLHL